MRVMQEPFRSVIPQVFHTAMIGVRSLKRSKLEITNQLNASHQTLKDKSNPGCDYSQQRFTKPKGLVSRIPIIILTAGTSSR